VLATQDRRIVRNGQARAFIREDEQLRVAIHSLIDAAGRPSAP
jgi:hypothetical protein